MAKKKKHKFTFSSISPDEIFLDSQNIPNFDSHQFEGRMEKPIGLRAFLFLGVIFLILGLFLFSRIGYLQIVKGEDFACCAENNHLRFVSLLPERGLIYDRNNELLAWNGLDGRSYKETDGFAHVVGYTSFSLPNEGLLGKEGAEKIYTDILAGEKGFKIVEVNSANEVKSESMQKSPVSGKNISLTIDFRIQNKLYEIFSNLSLERGFQGAAGVILDVESGEILAMTSYPEYSSQVLSRGSPKNIIQDYIQDGQKPFLNRVISGLYAPGSVIKPFVALAALNEKIISPDKQIFSSGSISIPHPYFSDKESVFYDWKAHGWVDMKDALAVSSNVYFYTIGGGHNDIGGLGIKKIQEYMEMFGFGNKTGVDLDNESEGLVPGGNSIWRIGDTYNASIGQGNFQVTPLQMAVATAILANNGFIIEPNIVLTDKESEFKKMDIDEEYFNIVREGMREAVLRGTARALNGFPVDIAAKTGTAELGSGKFVNSWLIAFWPYKNPRFALSIVLEKGEASNLIGGVFAMGQLMEWMFIHTPEYL